jgi:protein-tyrosine phosphatase
MYFHQMIKHLDQVQQIISLCPNNFNYPNHNHIKYDIEDKETENIIGICKDIYPKLNISTLIHCQAGKSRSASVVIYYIMKKYNCDFEKAHDFVNSKKSIGLNNGFRQQLKSLAFF